MLNYAPVDIYNIFLGILMFIKKYFFLLYGSFLYAQDAQTQTSTPSPITISSNVPNGVTAHIVVNSNTFYGTNTTTTETQTEISTAQDSKQDSKQENTQNPQQDTTHSAHQQAPQTTQQYTYQQPEISPFSVQSLTHSWNKKHILIGITTGLAISYIYIYSILYKAKQVMTSKHSWCNWKHPLTFSQILQTPRKELVEELLNDIQTRYQNIKNPTDYVFPMNTFLKELQKEQRRLKRYQKTMKILKKTTCIRIFFVKDLSPLIESRLEKLTYLNSLFFDWSQSFRRLQARQILKDPNVN